jgi:hypothetical protein
MGLGEIRVSKSALMSTVAVFATVGICVGTLIFLRPWPEHRAVDAMTASANLAAEKPSEGEESSKPSLGASGKAGLLPRSTGALVDTETPRKAKVPAMNLRAKSSRRCRCPGTTQSASALRGR